MRVLPVPDTDWKYMFDAAVSHVVVQNTHNDGIDASIRSGISVYIPNTTVGNIANNTVSGKTIAKASFIC